MLAESLKKILNHKKVVLFSLQTFTLSRTHGLSSGLSTIDWHDWHRLFTMLNSAVFYASVHIDY